MNRHQHLLILLSLVAGGSVVCAWEPSFMNVWDEQFHALVAKNMVESPMTPMLYAEALTEPEIGNWPEASIWLEKGPVPFWGIAFSFWCFGVSVVALRMASLVYYVAMMWVVWSYGRTLCGPLEAMAAAGFSAMSGALIWVASGGISSDHVEMAFVFWVSVGLLTVLRWSQKRTAWRAVLVGMVTGVAFLCKWYPAFLIPLVWVIRFYGDDSATPKSFRNLLSGAGCIVTGFAITAMPWVGYMYMQYPDELQYVLFKFLKAYDQIVEEHQGPWYYYLVKLTALFGEWIWVVLGAILVQFFKTRQKQLLAEVLIVMFVVLLFSFAETKRQTYLLILALPLFVLNGRMVIWLWEKRRQTGWAISGLVIVSVLTMRFALERIKPWRENRTDCSMVVKFDAFIKEEVSPGLVIFNHPNPIKLMFYRNVTAYGRMPTEADSIQLNRQNRPWVVYDAAE